MGLVSNIHFLLIGHEGADPNRQIRDLIGFAAEEPVDNPRPCHEAGKCVARVGIDSDLPIDPVSAGGFDRDGSQGFKLAEEAISFREKV